MMLYGADAIKIVTYDSSGIENTFYLRDFEDNLITTTTGTSPVYTLPEDTQNQIFIQNISPNYIVNNGNALLNLKHLQ